MSASYQGFRGLLIWQKAQDMAVSLTAEVGKLPHSRTIDAVTTQILRSAGSVPANIAEGYGRFSDGAYRNHLSIARGSLFETETWVDLLFRSGCISEEVNDRLIGQCDEVGRLLTAQMRNLASKGTLKIREERSLYFPDGPDNGL